MTPKKRIAIFTNKGYVWAFPVWKQSLPQLLADYDIAGLYLFPEKLGKEQNEAVKWWYLRVFGLWNFILLGLYAVKVRLFQSFQTPRTWQQLAEAHQIPCLEATTPNAPEVVQWVKDQGVDVLVIMFGHILKKDILEAPRMGIINKHASVLPSGGGIFPHFWARLHDFPAGVSIHVVEEDIDSGALLAQRRHPNPNISFLRFYIDAFAMTPALLREALERMMQGETLAPPPDIEASYYSFPTREDYELYRQHGYKIATLGDLFYQSSF